MRIHPIQTGTVAVRTRQREGAGRGPLRLVNTLLDKEWTQPLPILAWVIEHAEGLIVVDTGETARATQPGYLPEWHPYFRRGVREWIEPHQEVGPAMRAIGLDPGDVRWVVLTHLHTDHAGGLHHFPRSEFVVTRTEIDHARGTLGKLRGYLPHRWPDWFSPTPIDFEGEAFSSFATSRRLTDAGDVVLLPTPGHTPGHMSVAVEMPHNLVVLAGDASYTEGHMRSAIADGVTGNPSAARRTLESLQRLDGEHDLVYLPSHDPGSVARLAGLPGHGPAGDMTQAPRPRAVATR